MARYLPLEPTAEKQTFFYPPYTKKTGIPIPEKHSQIWEVHPAAKL